MKKLILILLFAVAVYPQTPLLTLMDDGITYEAETTAFISRVEADGGEVLDPDGLNSFIALLKAQGVYDNLKLLADPNWGVKKDAKGKITILYDLLGNDLTRSDTSKSPSLIDYSGNDAGITNLTSAKFDGADDCIRNTVISLAQPYTVIACIRPLGWTLYDTYFGADHNTPAWNHVYQLNVDGRLTFEAGTDVTNSNTMTVTGDMAVLRFVFNGASSKMQYNLESEWTTTGNIGTTGSDGFVLGAYTYADFNPSNIETGTIAIFDADLDATPTSAIQSFLMTRWGL